MFKFSVFAVIFHFTISKPDVHEKTHYLLQQKSFSFKNTLLSENLTQKFKFKMANLDFRRYNFFVCTKVAETKINIFGKKMFHL